MLGWSSALGGKSQGLRLQTPMSPPLHITDGYPGSMGQSLAWVARECWDRSSQAKDLQVFFCWLPCMLHGSNMQQRFCKQSRCQDCRCKACDRGRPRVTARAIFLGRGVHQKDLVWSEFCSHGTSSEVHSHSILFATRNAPFCVPLDDEIRRDSPVRKDIRLSQESGCGKATSV